MLEAVLRDLRHTLRSLIRAPGFTVPVVLTLALGIGAAVAMFTVVRGVLLRALPYPEAERLVQIWEVGEKGHRIRVTDPNFGDWRERSRSFRALAQFSQGSPQTVSGGREPVQAQVAFVSRDFFSALGVEPALGRTFLPEEQQLGAPPAAVVSHAFWLQLLDGRPDLEEVTLRYGGQVVAVVGVLPPPFDFPAGVEIWTPRELLPVLESRTAHNWWAIGRLAEGASLGEARREMSALAAQIRAESGDSTRDVALVPLLEEMVGPVRPALLAMIAAAGFLLVVSGATVTNLLVARLVSRRQELATRLALGISRRRFVFQCVAEALVLAAAGAGLGLLLASWGVPALLALEPGNLPRASEIRLDPTVVAFAAAIWLVTAAAVGTAGALQALGWARRGSLASSAKGHTEERRLSRLRGSLVTAQIALTLVLLTGCGLLARSLHGLLAIEPGFRTAGSVVAGVSLPSPESPEAQARLVRFHDQVAERLRAVPGIDEVGGVSLFPLTGRGWNGMFLVQATPDEIESLEDFMALAQVPERTGQAEFRIAGEGYFKALGIPLLAGRLFDAGDDGSAFHVALISASLARAQWPGEDPLGKIIQFGNMDGDLRPMTVVGVVGDVRDRGLAAEPTPTVYASYRQRARRAARFDYVITGSAPPSVMAAAAQRTIRELDPEIPAQVRTIEEVLTAPLAERRFVFLLLAVFATAATLLAAVGIYGVSAHAVAARSREIGIRVALGAPSTGVVGSMVGRAALLGLVGIALGAVASLLATRILGGLLYGVEANDPLTLAAAGILLLAATLVASYLPARRALRIDPLVALRGE